MLESHEGSYIKYHDIDMKSREVMFKVIIFAIA